MIDYIKANLDAGGIIRSNVKLKEKPEVVMLFFANPYYQNKFIEKLIAYLEKKIVLAKVGIEELTPSDVLALEILRDSSYFTEEKYQQWLKEQNNT